MTQNSFYKIVFYSLVILLFPSCDDYLSELPDNRTIIETPEQISGLLTGAYPNSSYMTIAEFMTDNTAFKGNENEEVLLLQSLYEWETPDADEGERDSPAHYWQGAYRAIAQANEALTNIERLQGEFDLNAQKGEALLARAYAHFMLVNLWGKHYNPSSADSDLGIPYVLEPETVLLKKYKRNTVKEVYDLIEKDIKQGLSLVENNYSNPKFHFTKEAANALAIRFYLYKGMEWDKIIEHASNVLINPANEIRDHVAMDGFTSDQIRFIYPNKDVESNLLLSSPTSLLDRYYDGRRYGMTLDIVTELFFNENLLGKDWAYSTFSNNGGRNRYLPKFDEYFRYTNATARIGQPYCSIVLFDKDEVLLSRAESYVMKEDYSSALNDLNMFLSKKTEDYKSATDLLTEALIQTEYPVIPGEYEPYYNINDKQTSFIKAIAEFRRREYIHEGLRWFDIKRFNIEVEHNIDKEGTNIVLKKDDPKRVLQIPASAITEGITPNPR